MQLVQRPFSKISRRPFSIQREKISLVLIEKPASNRASHSAYLRAFPNHTEAETRRTLKACSGVLETESRREQQHAQSLSKILAI